MQIIRKRRKIEDKGFRGVVDPGVPFWMDILTLVFMFFMDIDLYQFLLTSRKMYQLVKERAVFKKKLWLNALEDFQKLGEFFFQAIEIGPHVSYKLDPKKNSTFFRQKFLEEVYCRRTVDLCAFALKDKNGGEYFPKLKKIFLYYHQLELFNFWDFLKAFPRILGTFRLFVFHRTFWFSDETFKLFVKFGKFDRVFLSTNFFVVEEKETRPPAPPIFERVSQNVIDINKPIQTYLPPRSKWKKVNINPLSTLKARVVILTKDLDGVSYNLFAKEVVKRLRKNVNVEELGITLKLLGAANVLDPPPQGFFDLDSENSKIEGVVSEMGITEGTKWNLKKLAFQDLQLKEWSISQTIAELMDFMGHEKVECLHTLIEVEFQFIHDINFNSCFREDEMKKCRELSSSGWDMYWKVSVKEKDSKICFHKYEKYWA